MANRGAFAGVKHPVVGSIDFVRVFAFELNRFRNIAIDIY